MKLPVLCRRCVNKRKRSIFGLTQKEDILIPCIHVRHGIEVVIFVGFGEIGKMMLIMDLSMVCAHGS